MANEVAVAKETALVPAAGGFKRPGALEIMFDERLFAQASKVATMMAGARGIIPKHLVGCQEACFAVVVTAMTTGLNPYAVAGATYQTPASKVGFEGKLVIAILEASGRFEDDRIKFEHFGPWEQVQGKFENAESKTKDAEGNTKYYPKRKWTHQDAHGCGVRVSGRIKGETEERVYELLLTQCYPLNSTLWATDPKTQICYRAARGFGNIAAPSIMMGIPGDIGEPVAIGGDDAIDITGAGEGPQLAERPAPGSSKVIEADREIWEVITAEGEVVEFRHPWAMPSQHCIRSFAGAARTRCRMH